MKKVLLAHRQHHALYYLRNVIADNPANYIIVAGSTQALNGLDRGTEVISIRDRYYEPSALEMRNMAYALEVCHARSFVIKKVWI